MGDERKWFVPFYVDVGTGQSKLTWQINAGVGYQFDWGALVASWRYLDYIFKSDSKFTDLSLNGPLTGVVFNFYVRHLPTRVRQAGGGEAACCSPLDVT